MNSRYFNIENPLTHPSLDGVVVYSELAHDPVRGSAQAVLVAMAPNVEIPLHTHQVDADMLVVEGSAIVLSVDEQNGRHVKKGAKVRFAKDKLHGFLSLDGGMSFISSNGGIVDEKPDRWDLDFRVEELTQRSN